MVNKLSNVHPIMLTQLVRSQSMKDLLVPIIAKNVRVIIINQIRNSKWRKAPWRNMAAHERRLYYTGKPVFLHLNGDSYKRTRFVVRKEMKSFDSFLNAASLSLRTPAREIRTPGGRHRIQNLDDLERDGKYIVLGRERQFKKIELVNLFVFGRSRHQYCCSWT